jgi:pimeloyl-ACP methyl ester carboxylesterase
MSPLLRRHTRRSRGKAAPGEARLRRSFLLAAGAVSVVGCAGSSERAEPKPPPSVTERCAEKDERLEGQSIWFPASDGTRLSGAVLGQGRVGVVLAHGYPSSLCEWTTYAPVLARAGFRVLMFDFRGFGLSRRGRTGDYLADIRGAAAELRRLGAERVVLMGSSFGATAVLSAAPTVRPPAAGVVSVSALLGLSGRVSSFSPPASLAPRMRTPVLLMWARGDHRFRPREVRRFLRAVPVRDKAVAAFPGDWHGVSLLQGVPAANRLLMSFLRRRG